jgi:hypothetical protein
VLGPDIEKLITLDDGEGSAAGYVGPAPDRP